MHRLRNKYRMSIINESTFEEKISYRLTPMNVLVAGVFCFLLLGFAFISLVVFTPLREFIPGYTDASLRIEAIENAARVDSLENQLRIKSNYVNNLVAILNDEPVEDSTRGEVQATDQFDDIEFKTSREDSLFREQFEEQEKYNIATTDLSEKNVQLGRLTQHFFPPVRGLITQRFHPETGHMGVDIVAGERETVKAALEGTVIESTWSSDGGYMLAIQHGNNYVTIYKHNSVLLKETGDKVQAGASVAIIGNSGEMTTGPHLHFEVWKEGIPVDPEKYVIFE